MKSNGDTYIKSSRPGMFYKKYTFHRTPPVATSATCHQGNFNRATYKNHQPLGTTHDYHINHLYIFSYYIFRGYIIYDMKNTMKK